jgi:hypothetical protein
MGRGHVPSRLWGAHEIAIPIERKAAPRADLPHRLRPQSAGTGRVEFAGVRTVTGSESPARSRLGPRQEFDGRPAPRA